jgi:hypothetical protein
MLPLLQSHVFNLLSIIIDSAKRLSVEATQDEISLLEMIRRSAEREKEELEAIGKHKVGDRYLGKK